MVAGDIFAMGLTILSFSMFWYFFYTKCRCIRPAPYSSLGPKTPLLKNKVDTNNSEPNSERNLQGEGGNQQEIMTYRENPEEFAELGVRIEVNNNDLSKPEKEVNSAGGNTRKKDALKKIVLPQHFGI